MSSPAQSPKDSGPSQAPAAEVVASLDDGKKHLLIAASGSVSTIKLPLILSALGWHPNLSIRVILTNSAARFLAGQSDEQPTVASLLALPNVDSVYQDDDEWSRPWTREANILHIELRRWAHMFAIVPMSANLLAKIAGGLCDNLLTNIVRAWEIPLIPTPTTKHIIAAPAMNTLMWTHPITARQIKTLEEWGFEILPPQIKTLACGDVGQGALCDWMHIVGVIEEHLCLALATPQYSERLSSESQDH